MSDRETQDQKICEIWAEISRRSPVGVPEPCPDAEILSAYHAQALTEIEKARWEAHFSLCAACQEALAALAVSEEKAAEPSVVRAAIVPAAAGVAPPAISEISPRQIPAPLTIMKPRRAVWHWVAPAAAAAVLLAAWLGFRETPVSDTPVQTAQNTPAAPLEQKSDKRADQKQEPEPQRPSQDAVAPSTSAESDQQAKVSENKPQAASRLSAMPQKNSAAQSARGFSRAEPRQNEALPKTGAADGRSNDALLSELRATSAPKSSAPSRSAEVRAYIASVAKNKAGQTQGGIGGASSGADAVRGPLEESPQRPPVGTAQQQVIPAAPQSSALPTSRGQVSDTKEEMQHQERSKAASIPRGPRTIGVQPARTGAAGAMNSVLAKQELTTKVFAPNLQTFWIAGPVGKVQHSVNGGLSVITQNTGVLADLLAGSAPSQTVCWMVGRAGTILLTTDGQHWSKVGAPGDQDWVGVRATDALHALIWDKDQLHTFGTSDGGKTWTSVP